MILILMKKILLKTFSSSNFFLNFINSSYILAVSNSYAIKN